VEVTKRKGALQALRAGIDGHALYLIVFLLFFVLKYCQFDEDEVIG